MPVHDASGAEVDDDSVTGHRVVVGVLDTNCWLLHAPGDSDAILIDPGDEATQIFDFVSFHRLNVLAVILTHAHFDHVLALGDILSTIDIPVLAHPAEADVWAGELSHLRTHGHWDAGTATDTLLNEGSGRLTLPSRAVLWDGRAEPVHHGQEATVGDLTVRLLHTPGHTPGSLTIETGRHLFTGDTLFPGGPGLTGAAWPSSNFTSIMTSVQDLLTRDDDTAIHPGHGPGTVVGRERPHAPAWRARGW